MDVRWRCFLLLGTRIIEKFDVKCCRVVEFMRILGEGEPI